MKIKMFLFVALALNFVAAPVLAGDDDAMLKFKSHSTARILSLIPINSPAIFYVNRPVRGAVYSILEAGGLTMVGFGAYFLSKIDDSHIFGAFAGNNVLKASGISMVSFGSAAWMAPWIHTVVATSDYVDGCNQKIREKAGIVSFYPVINSNGKEDFYGLGLHYVF